MPGPVYLSGERVELRVTEREDVELVQRARSDPAIRTALTQTAPQTREQVDEFYDEYVSVDNGDADFVVCVRSDDESANDDASEDPDPIGEVSLFRTEHDHGEISYWLLPEARGEGYATEAVSLLLDYAFDTSGRHRVYARVVDFNGASRALVERLGFAEEGRLREHVFLEGAYRDVVLYGLLRDEWDGAP
ncbi:GNAT family N-acetyltransferase [Halorussus limi]|uniref:GNAT family N-acetyltransferase n=1 Tax=Halorussus limi TaxID=2938695 RepID=A0A8U0HSQ6_9EURY|nr:GNAT family protein [Halorussus limi]UPV74030.1 GNAT family N-acetyltransferase [Halorussus limi]